MISQSGSKKRQRSEGMIRLESVHVTFRHKNQDLVAVKDVSLVIGKGEIFGIVGSSGAGKSSLLRTLNGLQKPSSGKVWIEDEEISTMNAKELRKIRKKMGMIFQHFNLITRKTVGENVRFALEIQKVPKEQRESRVKELLKLVGLEDKKDYYPSQLSGGEKQRVGIARALAASPSILLCDEATSALDPTTTEEIVDLLRSVARTLGITVVFITHQLEIAKHLFDRIAVMSYGEVVELQDTYSIFASPKHPLTKGWVEENRQIPKDVWVSTPGEKLLLTYKGNKSLEPVIAMTHKKFDVTMNILHGKIEYIQGKPIGVLLISLNGDHTETEKAKVYLIENVEEVKVIHIKEGAVA